MDDVIYRKNKLMCAVSNRASEQSFAKLVVQKH